MTPAAVAAAFAWVAHVEVLHASSLAAIWYQPNTSPVTVTWPYDASLKYERTEFEVAKKFARTWSAVHGWLVLSENVNAMTATVLVTAGPIEVTPAGPSAVTAPASAATRNDPP